MSVVYCYKNLRTHQWSLYARPRHKCDLTGAPVDGKHAGFPELALRGVRLEVNQASWARVRKNRLPSGKPYREVHAWAIGEVFPAGELPTGARVAISYHPDKGNTFYRRDTGAPVSSAEYVHFTSSGEAYAIGQVS